MFADRTHSWLEAAGDGVCDDRRPSAPQTAGLAEEGDRGSGYWSPSDTPLSARAHGRSSGTRRKGGYLATASDKAVCIKSLTWKPRNMDFSSGLD